jgi:hypothetical protein
VQGLARPHYINNIAPAYIPSHMQPISNVIQQGNYIYNPSAQLADIATVKNGTDIGEQNGEQTFYQL